MSPLPLLQLSLSVPLALSEQHPFHCLKSTGINAKQR